MTREIDIQNAIRAVLEERGHLIWRMNVGNLTLASGRRISTGVPKGFPDLFGLSRVDHRAFFIEVKNETGKRRKEQVEFANQISQWGVRYGVARSVEEAVRIVEEK